MILVDTNVVLDLVNDDSDWAEWSESRLIEAATLGPVAINGVIYAELAAGYDSIEDLDEMVGGIGLRVEEIPRDALFLAGKAFLRYRRQGGARTNVLADFFIGAHAAATGMSLLTRDRRRYATYFPSVRLIAPD